VGGIFATPDLCRSALSDESGAKAEAGGGEQAAA
jgi:hypothetical protein